MAERGQTSEARTYGVFFRDSTGAPVGALTPTVTVGFKDGTAGAPTATATAAGPTGFYRIALSAAPTKDLFLSVDGGSSLTTTRYAALEVPVGGYIDQIDASVTSRAAATAVATLQTAVTALGSPAQATDTATLLGRLTAARAILLDGLSHLDVDVSSRASSAALALVQTDTTNLLSRLTGARATLLDNLALLDATVSSRATHAEATSDTSGTATLLARLTVTRAGLLDSLTLLDVAISSRSTSAAVTALGAPAQAAALVSAQTDLTTLLGRISSVRAGLLDQLSNLDAPVSSRATGGDTVGTTTLLGRLTATRAGLLDALTQLDVGVSTRASAAAVTALGSPAQASAIAAVLTAVGTPAQAAALAANVTALLTEIDTHPGTTPPQISSGP